MNFRLENFKFAIYVVGASDSERGFPRGGLAGAFLTGSEVTCFGRSTLPPAVPVLTVSIFSMPIVYETIILNVRAAPRPSLPHAGDARVSAASAPVHRLSS